MNNTNWAIKRTPDTYKLINEYFSRVNNKRYNSNGTWRGNLTKEPRFYDFLIEPAIYKATTRVEDIPKGYKEISFEEFRIHILHLKPKYYELY